MRTSKLLLSDIGLFTGVSLDKSPGDSLLFKQSALRGVSYAHGTSLASRGTCACNALHVIEARFCPWLLQTADRAASDTVTLTQEFLAEMRGVRRTSVTDVASKIQNTGAISYSRGVIKILDRPALESMFCECYQTLLDQSATLA